MSDACKNLINRLLETDPRQRLTDAVRVKAHPFFVGDDPDFWLTISSEEPPFVPEQKAEDDTSNFDERIEFFNVEVDDRIGDDDGGISSSGTVSSSGGDSETSSSDSDEEVSQPLANDSSSNLQNFWHVNVTNLAARTK
jgi:serine/threonine protein kinase